MKKKKDNHNTQKENQAKNLTKYVHFDEYLNSHSFRQTPMSEHGIEKLIHAINEWSLKEDSYVLQRLWDQVGVPRETLHAWRKKHPKLDAAYKIAKDRVGANRELGALTKKLDPTTMKHRQYQFCEGWKEADEYHAKIKAKYAQDQKESVKVIIEQAPSSKLVPDRE